MQWCTACDRGRLLSAGVLPALRRAPGRPLEWREASGRATVHAAVVEHRPEAAGAAFAQGEPFCIALVDLEEGVRMMTNVVGCPPDDVHSGMAVTVTWEPLSDGRQLALFRPRPEGVRDMSVARGQARRSGPGHAARLVGGPDPGPPGADHPARGPHLRRPQRGHQPAVAGRCGPAGLQPGDAVALMCTNEPEFLEVLYAAQRTGLRLTPINWHLTGEEAAYIIDELRGQGLRLLRHRWATRSRVAAAAGGPGLVKINTGGYLPGFEMYKPVVAAEDGSDIEDPVLGTQMLYTSGTTGPAQGRAPRHARPSARWPPSTSAATTRTTRRSVDAHLLHRPALPRRPAGLLGGRPLPLRRAARDHGPLGPRRGAAPHRAARDHPHPHGPDHVPPPAGPARRDAGALRHLVAALRDPRRGAVPRAGQAAA